MPPNEPDNPYALGDYWDGRNDRAYDDALEREALPTAPPRPVLPAPPPKRREDMTGVGDFLVVAVLIPLAVAVAAGGVAWYLDADVRMVAVIAAAVTLGLLVVGNWSDFTEELQGLIVLTVAIPVAIWLVLAWRGRVDWIPPQPW